MQFPVLSDVHIGTDFHKERFKKALNDVKMIAPNYNAIVLLGDNTNMGTEQEYVDFNSIMQTYANKEAEKIFAIGNHDYFEGIYLSPYFDPLKYQKRFTEMTGVPGLYYDKWIHGYHFITLGSEGFPDGDDDDDHVLMSDQQYNWLEETIGQEADPAKPIFVFLHQPIDNTVYGSEEWGAGFTDTRLSDMLKNYPQVILFSGHTHYLLQHPRTIFQDGFTMVNAGSVAYGYTDLGYPGTSQGLLVNVYSDRVEIKAREFTDNSDIQTFTVKTPYVKTYGDTQKPYFNLNSQIRVEKNSSGESAVLSFEAARDNTLVDRYIIKQNGEIIQTVYVNFWNMQIPNRMSVELKGLKPDTAYNLEISAVDAWNNESFNTLKTSIKTPKLNGWKVENVNWVFYENGKKVTGWKSVDDQWYLFSQNGFLYTGWYTSGSQKYYLNDNGVMQVGWKEIDGETYYFNPDGALQRGWVQLQNKWYYFDKEGRQKLGWILDGTKWYYLKSDGMVSNWQYIDNKTWYFFNSSGSMQTGWLYSAGSWYFLSSSGAMKTGWVWSGGNWYFMSDSGAMKTGWLLERGKWYYLKNDGAMQTGWAKIDNKWYNFSNSGILY